MVTNNLTPINATNAQTGTNMEDTKTSHRKALQISFGQLFIVNTSVLLTTMTASNPEPSAVTNTVIGIKMK